MGGKTGTTTQQSSVSIPPEVMARYNAVNTRAENVANQQFTPYTGEFVAPLTGTQQAGISNINQAQGMATPYYNAAGNAMAGSYQAAQPYYGAATGSMQGGQQNADLLQGESYQGINQAYAGAQPYQQAATQGVTQAYAGAQPYQQAATQGVTQAYAGAQPYQQAATQGLAQAYAGAQPYQGIATNLGLSGANAVNPDALTGQNINQYMSPYLNSVVGSTMANLRQQQQQEQSQILGDQIKSGAFGGDRGRIAQANLARQQELASGQTVAGLMNQGYGQALTTAQQQQAQQLSAEQANRAARAGAGQQLAAIGQQGFGQGVTNAQQLAALGQQGFGQGITTAQQLAAIGQQGFGQGTTTAQQLAAIGQQGFGQGMTAAERKAALGQQAFGQGTEAAKTYQGLGQGLYGMGQDYGKNVAGLGTQAQESALKGAQAQLGAGTLEQQTQQALNTANYNQFLQQQGYPFQVAQFLANIAMGTGALSGSSQQGTTTSPQSFFSDRRLKDDIEKIGKTFDGQDIVRYKYKGEPGTRIGLIAQDVEKHHPEAVGLAGGYRTVDYDKATDDAAHRGHFAGGGLAGGYSSEGGAVMPEMAGMGFAAGGAPDINSMIAEILNAHQGMYPFGKAGLYGQTGGRSGAYGTSQMQTPTRGLMRVDPSAFVRPVENQGVGQQAMQGLNNARAIGSAYTDANSFLFGTAPNKDNPEGTRGTFGNAGNPSVSQGSVARAFSRDTPPTTPQANTPAPAATTPRQEPTAPAAPPVEAPPAPSPGDGGGDETGGYGSDDYYTGGLVRGHYAMGGLPFSDAGGYIPDAVLNDNERDKNKKALDSFTPKASGAGQSSSGSGLMGGLGQIGGAIGGAKGLSSLFGGAGEAAAGAGEAAAGASAAAEAASAANIAAGSAEGFGSFLAMLPMLSDRRLKDDIEKIGKTFDGQDIVRYRYKGEPATQIGLIAQDVEKHHPDAVGLAGGYRTVDYHKATEDAANRGHFAGGGLAGVRHGYALDGEVVDEVVEPKQAGLAGAGDLNPEVERIRNALSAIESSGRYNAIGRDVVRPGREPDRAYGRYQVMGENVGPWTEAAFGQRMTPDEFLGSSKAQDAVVRNRIQQGLDRYGNAQDVASVWFSGRPVNQAGESRDANNVSVPEYLRRFQSAYDANNTSAPAPEGRAGLRAAVPSDNTGLGAISKQDMSGDSGSNEATDYRAEVRRALNPEPREAPNWMQRNQDWLVPLLSGVGAMASSPSRYLGAALLQGVGGGAQQYAAMQQRGEEQQRAREQLGVSRANTLVSQQREQVAEQQLREQMIQRVLQQFGDQLSNGMYRDPFSGQLVSPQRRMQIAMQMAAGTSSTGVPARAPAGEGAAPPAAGETGGAPPAAGETGATPPATPPANGAPATSPAAGETAATPPAAAPPAAGAPAAGGTPATRPANARPRLPWENPPQFVPEDDPVQLRARAHIAQNVPGQRAAEEAARLETTARKIESGEIEPRDINGNLYNGFVLRRQEEARQKTFLDEERAAQRVHYDTSPQITQNVREAARLMTAVNTGRSSDFVSSMSSIIRSFPGGSAVVPDFVSAIQAATETERKAALEEGFRKLQAQAQQGAGGRTNMALVEMMQTMADPRLGPEARYSIITRTLGREAQNDAWYDSLDRRPAGVSLQQWRRQFNEEHSLDRYINEVKSTMPGFAGMTPALRRQFGTSDAALPENLRGSDYNPLAPFQMRTVNGRQQFLMNGVIYDDQGRQIERVTQ